MQPFIGMDVVLMPNVLQLVTKTEVFVKRKMSDLYESDLGYDEYYEVPSDNIDSIYRLAKSCHPPEMVSFLSLEAKARLLEAENASQNAKILPLESETAGQKRMIDKPRLENKKLQFQLADLPNKRAKANNG